MSKAEIRSITADSKVQLAFRHWSAGAERPTGVVLYLHGIQSHGGWYVESARRLAEAGLEVYQPDRRGSGLNRTNRGHVDSHKRWLADAMALVELAGQEHPDLPFFLLAVSWGGKLAVALAKAHHEQFAGLALIAPGLFPLVDVGAAAKLRIALALVTGGGRRMFPIPLSDAHLFTANPARIRFIESDDLSLRKVTARFMYESRRLDSYVRDAGAHISMPVFLALASEDRIIDNKATRQYVEGFRSCDKCVREYRGAHHTLEFEADPRAFFQDMVSWLTQQAANKEVKVT